MRHGDKINNLGRKTAHRHALLRNLTRQLIEHKRIITTLAKAKALRKYAEPLINKAKEDTMHHRRLVFSHLQDKESIKELFDVIGDKIANRPGGYTRIIKMQPRVGDAADIALIELVDFNESYVKDAKGGPTRKTRRSRRSSGAAKKDAVTASETTPSSTANATNAVETVPASAVVPASNESEGPAVDHSNTIANPEVHVAEPAKDAQDAVLATDSTETPTQEEATNTLSTETNTTRKADPEEPEA